MSEIKRGDRVAASDEYIAHIRKDVPDIPIFGDFVVQKVVKGPSWDKHAHGRNKGGWIQEDVICDERGYDFGKRACDVKKLGSNE